MESAYEKILCFELEKRKIPYIKQPSIPINYEGLNIDNGFRADIIVDNKVILELKSIKKLDKAHKKQLLTYLKLTGLKLGLLINFNEKKLVDGVKRIVNGL